MAVQEDRDGPRVGDDAGHVGGGGEAADLERSAVVGQKLRLELRQVDAPVVILRDDHHVGDRFAPRQLVGMVFVGPDEDDRSLLGGDATAQLVAVVECLRDAQPQDRHELVDGGRRARPREDDGMLGSAATRVQDDVPGFLAESRRLQPGARGFRVRVGVQGQHGVPQVVLDEGQRAT